MTQAQPTPMQPEGKTCRILLLPPSVFANRSLIERQLVESDFNPVGCLPAGSEGEILTVPIRDGKALHSQGFAVLIPETGAAVAQHSNVKLADYVEKYVFGNQVLRCLERRLDKWNIHPLRPIIWRAPGFSFSRLQEFRAAIVSKDWLTYSSEYFDHFWLSNAGAPLPLALRMQDDADPIFCNHGMTTYSDDRRLVTRRQAGLYRDELFTSFAEALKKGDAVCTGVLAQDVDRKTKKIDPGWWQDTNMMCDLKNSELKPDERAASGMPHFRDVRVTWRPHDLRVASEDQIAAAIRSEYSQASGKAPNLNQLYQPVQTRLATIGVKATKVRIQDIAASSPELGRRGGAGRPAGPSMRRKNLPT